MIVAEFAQYRDSHPRASSSPSGLARSSRTATTAPGGLTHRPSTPRSLVYRSAPVWLVTEIRLTCELSSNTRTVSGVPA